MIEIDSLKKSSGKIIYGYENQDILDLPVEKIRELFKSSGLLIFRNFNVSRDFPPGSTEGDRMKAFAQQFTAKFIRDSNRTFVDDFLGLVDQGMYALGPHCENGTTAFRPDAVWFCCAVPATQGGETLFWDGVRVWEELSEELKQLFVSKKTIIFSNSYSAEAWKHFLGAETTLDDVKHKLDGLEGLTYSVEADLSISIEFSLPSAFKTKYGDRNVFAHSFMMEYSETGEMDYFKTGTVKFADGSLIPETAVYEIHEVLDRLTEVIPLQAGELVMVDNSRFLHGRRAFNDARRQIYSLLSYLNF